MSTDPDRATAKETLAVHHTALVGLAQLFSMGFRPLYIAGSCWAAASVAIWVFAPNLASGQLGGLAWHAHEMLWGFIATIAAGFLLTASATWTSLNPMQGKFLMATCLVWGLARAFFLIRTPAAFAVASVCELSFFALSALALSRVVVAKRSRRNYVLPGLLVLVGVADAFYLLAVSQGNLGLALQRFDTGLLCMAVIALLVGRRVIPFFAMRAVPGLKIPMHESSAVFQLVAGIGAVLLSFSGLKAPLAIGLIFVSIVAAWQLMTWKPWAVAGKPILWILYAGYGAVAAGLLLASLHALGMIQSAALHTHVIAIGGLSVLIIGMVTRTALGHLARPLVLDRSMRLSYLLVLAAFVFRMLALVPSSWSVIWIQISATTWIGAFAMYVTRFAPMMVRPVAISAVPTPGVTTSEPPVH